MRPAPRPTRLAAAILALGIVAGSSAVPHARTDGPRADDGARAAAVRHVFGAFDGPDRPGCAVGVARGGRVIVERGFGMADLERDVPITAATVFEAGSVSKQFTAAAVWLLAADGRLSLDDPVRLHVPEVPDYGTPVTVRQMLTHTSGLRDWGDIAAIAGWPRTTRAHTHAHVLDIVSRQRALNFTPGAQYSYSNSGYNLAAILVSRLSGTTFAEFTRQRLFVPLGMPHTSWRDDHARLVKHRAVAYITRGREHRILMPFEDVHGNGGLLTTVGDLLRWNENLARPRVGGRALVAALERPARLADGREVPYGLGLRLATYRGLREVGHGGITAGYRAYLGRFPEEDLSVAILCNTFEADAERLGHRVADLFLTRASGAPTTADPPAAPVVPTSAAAPATPGATPVAASPAGVPPAGQGNGPTACPAPCAPEASGSFAAARPAREPSASASSADGGAELVGRYRSDEADVTFAVERDGTALRVTRHPADAWPVRWIAPDTFVLPVGRVRVLRDGAGRVTALSLATARVHDLRFTRMDP